MRKILLYLKLIRYNQQIVFSGRFVWFLLASLAFYLFFLVMLAINEDNIQYRNIYDILVFPGIILMFYPTVFGIQHDVDSRTIELMFGVPDYRFKIWLFRVILIILFVFLLLVAFGYLAWVLIEPIPAVEFAFYLMFPLVFLGSMAFMVSTFIKSGNATAVVMVLLGIILWILGEELRSSYWNIFLNPYEVPYDLNQAVWAKIILKNRIFLSVGMVVFLLAGMLKLQRREKYIG